MPSLPFSALINVFPDITGEVQSETTIKEKYIPAPPLFWSRMNPDFKREEAGETENWRELILFKLRASPNTRIHITNDSQAEQRLREICEAHQSMVHP